VVDLKLLLVWEIDFHLMKYFNFLFNIICMLVRLYVFNNRKDYHVSKR